MRPALATLAVVLSLVGAQPAAALAQEPAQSFVEVQLRDGSKLYGTVVSEDAARVVVRTIAGAEVTLTPSQIKAINRTAGTVVNGEFWTDDVVDSKLFLGSTGRSLKRGEGYFAIDSLFLPVFQVGVTDRFSVGMGVPFYGFVKTAWITPKYQLYRGEKTSVATGVLHLFVPDFGLGGYGYVVATRGNARSSVTFGGGMLYGRDDGDGGALPIVTIGGEHRTSRRSKLVTENYIFKEGIVVSVGMRIIGQTVSTELGGLLAMTDGGRGMPGFFFNFVFHGRPKNK